jgi:3-hydroxy acid dehydrogenase / malonic semialdehyde reductase
MATHLELSSATALVTGAGSGIGKAITQALLREGVRVVACDRDAERLEALTQEHSEVLPWVLDVTDPAAINELPGALPLSHQQIDILVNSAGHDIGGRRAFVAGEAEKYAAIIQTNVVGLISMTLACATGMAARGLGHIINLGSTAGLRPEAMTSTYTASKHAVHGFSDCLRKDFVGTGVRVTELNPGRVRTNFGYARATTREEADQHYDAVGICLSPDDVANAVIYALRQPAHVVVAQMVIMPADQA